MPEFGDAFSELADTDNMMEAGMVLGGLGASVVVKNGIDSRFDLPDELYGVGVAAGAYSMDYDYVAIGGLGYAGLQLAERVGLKGTVEQAGQ